ncbi:MAG TPA: RloB family protein [Aquella sp.]|nr:RloB family protein [Aquella sp.]
MSRNIQNKRQLKTVVWIYTEGEKTEPYYFESMIDDLDLSTHQTVKIHIDGTGYNTDSLVKKAEDKLDKDGGAVDHIWCVMDRDSFKKYNFNKAFELTKNKKYCSEDGKPKIEIAYSNECFELWFVLHYEYRNSDTPRADYTGILSKHLNRKYEKNLPNVYNQLKGKQETAIKNARKLRESYCSINSDGRHSPVSDNPSTNVDQLVEFLQKLAN